MLKMDQANGVKGEWLFSILLLVSALALLALKWAIYSQYGYQSDVFSYSRAIANTLDGPFMWDPVHTYLFGSHSYLLLLLFLPIYAVQASPFVLVGSSVAAHILASWFVFRLGEKLFSSKWTGVGLGAMYLINPFVLEHIVMPVYGFQPDVWAPPFIFAACYYFSMKRMKATLCFLVLLASVKEEFALLGVGLVGLFLYDRVLVWISPKMAFLSEKGAVPISQSLRQLLLLGVGSLVCVAISIAVLKHGKTISEFHFAPTLSLEQIAGILKGPFLPGAYAHLLFYLPSFLFLPLLFPELLAVVVLRIGINLAVYNPNTPLYMSIGQGWCWGNIAVINLLFLSLLFGLKRLKTWFGVPSSVVGALVYLGVFWNAWLILKPEALGFRSAVLLAPQYSQDVPEAVVSRKKSVKTSRRVLDRAGGEGLLLVSPELMVDFADRDTSVAQFALQLSPRLYSQAQGAVLLRTDSFSVQALDADPAFRRIHADKNVLVFKRILALEK